MSRLARHGLRTTAAAAGLAALGAGIAAPALAAPEGPVQPASPVAPAPDTAAVEEMLAGLGDVGGADAAELPELFTFEMPTINEPSAGMHAAQAPALELPAGPEDVAIGPDGDSNGMNIGPDGDAADAMPELDMPSIRVGPVGSAAPSAPSTMADDVMTTLSEGVSFGNGVMG